MGILYGDYNILQDKKRRLARLQETYRCEKEEFEKQLRSLLDETKKIHNAQPINIKLGKEIYTYELKDINWLDKGLWWPSNLIYDSWDEESEDKEIRHVEEQYDRFVHIKLNIK